MFQTGEQMGGVDLIFNLKMEDQVNVIRMLMKMRKAHAVPHEATAVTVIISVQ